MITMPHIHVVLGYCYAERTLYPGFPGSSTRAACWNSAFTVGFHAHGRDAVIAPQGPSITPPIRKLPFAQTAFAPAPAFGMCVNCPFPDAPHSASEAFPPSIPGVPTRQSCSPGTLVMRSAPGCMQLLKLPMFS